MNGGRVLAVSSPSDRCLLMWIETDASRSSSREIGRLSWSLSNLVMEVIEKRLADVGNMR